VDAMTMVIDITNCGDEEFFVYWIFEPSSDFPEEWKFQICDASLCCDWGTGTFSTLYTFLINTIPARESIVFTLKDENTGNMINGTYLIFGESFGILKLYDKTGFMNPYAISSSCMFANNNTEIDDLVIYPNPTADIFQLKSDDDISYISIYNVIGGRLSAINIRKGEVHDISTLRAAMYLVSLQNREDEIVNAMRLFEQ
jgi:hypothetical protein